MNGYECDGTGEAKLNSTCHLSPHENICTITAMKNIHYLFYILVTSKIYFCNLQRLINLNILEIANSVLIAPCQV